MKIKFLFSAIALSLCFTATFLAQTANPTINFVSPDQIEAPITPGAKSFGTFTISGANLQGAEITTNGPINLLGTTTVNPNGTLISRSYEIGCCAPYHGQTFNLFVYKPGFPQAFTTVTIYFSQLPQNTSPIIAGVNPGQIPAPNTSGGPFTGRFSISGTNLQGAEITTDGPIALFGPSAVNSDGTLISRSYAISYNPDTFEGKTFNLFVVKTGFSQASTAVTIQLKPRPTVTALTPNPVLAPVLSGQTFTGILSINGANLQGTRILNVTGPLSFTGPSVISPDGTSVQTPYKISSGNLQEGQPFNILFGTPYGFSYQLQGKITLDKPVPTIISVNPNPVEAPSIEIDPFSGTFTVDGTKLYGGEITTNGPIVLEGSSTVNATGTSIQRNYKISCCNLLEGQTFNLLVTTPYGQASTPVTVSLVKPTANMLQSAFGLIPDAAFIGSVAERRAALLDKLAAVSDQISGGNYKGARQKLIHDLKPRIEAWVIDNYSKETNAQLTKTDIMKVIDAMIIDLSNR